MNKKQLILVWVILLFVFNKCYGDSGLIIAEGLQPIDESLQECWKDTGATSVMKDCLLEAYGKWEAEMNKYYNLLMQELNAEAKKKLEQSQKAWLKFQKLEYEFIPTYFKDLGTYIGPTSMSDEVRVIRARALQLMQYYKTIKDE